MIAHSTWINTCPDCGATSDPDSTCTSPRCFCNAYSWVTVTAEDRAGTGDDDDCVGYMEDCPTKEEILEQIREELREHIRKVARTIFNVAALVTQHIPVVAYHRRICTPHCPSVHWKLHNSPVRFAREAL